MIMKTEIIEKDKFGMNYAARSYCPLVIDQMNYDNPTKIVEKRLFTQNNNLFLL